MVGAEARVVDARIGPHLILAPIGQGGMGAVYKARHEATGAEVALKVVLPDLARDERFVERFQREARAAAAVSHPNVARCLGSGVDAGKLWIAFEYLPGGTLKDRLKSGPLPWREAAAAGAAVARGLEAIHATGIVHRDMKPANVLIGPDGAPRISDFGLARGTGKAGLTRTGEILGTTEYMAPELVDGGREASPRSDLYALGATLYCLLTGAPPFPGTGPSVLMKHIRETPRPPRSIVPEIPPELDALVLRLLEKEPMARGDAASVARELDAIAKLTEPSRRRGLVAILAAAAVVAIVAFVVLRSSASTATPTSDAGATRPTQPGPDRSATPKPPEAKKEPEWFRNLPASKRPGRIPAGLLIGEKENEYVAQKDSTLVLVYVRGGTFSMGYNTTDKSVINEDEGPVHRVELTGYFIGKLEVTNKQFDTYASKTKKTTLAEQKHTGKHVTLGMDPDQNLAIGTIESDVADLDWRRPELDPRDPTRAARNPPPDWVSRPVVLVTWDEARDYAEWAGLRLATEAEWERAAGWEEDKQHLRRYAWGDAPPGESGAKVGNLLDKKWHDAVPNRPPMISFALGPFREYDDDYPGLAPVGKFPAGASPVGALDMTGNAREWVIDFSGPYARFKDGVKDPCNLDPDKDAKRLSRGGSYTELPVKVRVTYREDVRKVPGGADDITGIRVAISENRDLEEKLRKR
jgi:serine/threonine protein kinase